MRYEGNGRFSGVARVDREIADDMAEPGQVVLMRLAKKRSNRQNAYFHALIQAAFDNQTAGPLPPSPAHLKAWLLCDAGHCEEYRVPLASLKPEHVRNVAGTLASALKRNCDTMVTSYDTRAHELVLRVARSWSFRALGPELAAEILDKVIGVICTQVCPGMSPEDLRRHAKNLTGDPSNTAHIGQPALARP